MKTITVLILSIFVSSCDINLSYDVEKLVVKRAEIKINNVVFIIPDSESKKYLNHTLYDAHATENKGVRHPLESVTTRFKHRVAKKVQVNRGIGFRFELPVQDRYKVKDLHKITFDEFRIDTEKAFLSINGVKNKLVVDNNEIHRKREYFEYDEKNTRPYAINMLWPTRTTLSDIYNGSENNSYSVFIFINFGDVKKEDKAINRYLPLKINDVDIVIDYEFDINFERIVSEELITIGVPGGSP